MVNNMDPKYHYALADDTELDQLLSGHGAANGTLWAQSSKPPRPRPGSTGVIWAEGDSSDQPAHPLVLISNEEDIRHLCGRYAQLRSDLSPLTAWCHLLTPRFLEPLDSLVRKADLGGMQAAWTGLIVAEAVLLAGISVANVRISACLATQSFAIARTNALWNHVPVDDIGIRFDAANRLCRSENGVTRGEGRIGRLRASLEPIWETLVGLSQERSGIKSGGLEPVIAALQALRRAKSDKDKQEAGLLVAPLLSLVPEAEMFEQLTELAPEVRLRLFDKLVNGLSEIQGDRISQRRTALAVLAGYLATVAAGGAPSLSLAETHAARWPEITAWAYLIGGIGESVVWTSSFDGLGRLVARELLRPLRLDEPPTCDFAFDEAAVLVDSKLADPLVHLRVKQARLVTVGLLPGVNISIPIADSTQGATRSEPNRTVRPLDASTNGPLRAFADALWPHIRIRIDEYMRSVQGDADSRQEGEDSSQNRGKRKAASPSQLPLGGPRKY